MYVYVYFIESRSIGILVRLEVDGLMYVYVCMYVCTYVCYVCMYESSFHKLLLSLRTLDGRIESQRNK